MAPRREGLRNLLPKPQKKAKTNAEKSREYRKRLKQDPVRWDAAKQKKKEQNRHYGENMTDAQREKKKEQDRIAQQKRRDKLKEKREPKTTPQKLSKPRTTRQAEEDAERAAQKREKARLRQQKRRLNMSIQKQRREREKRMHRYYNKKVDPKPTHRPQSRRPRLDTLLNGVKSSLTRSRTKLALYKLDFVKKILNRQRDSEEANTFSFYKRQPVDTLDVESYYMKVSVDVPFKKGGNIARKVLTKTLLDSYQDFKKCSPNLKMSFATFKRRRPAHIALSYNRKFIQCLCEKCTNAMLLMNVLNVFLEKKTKNNFGSIYHKITCVEELVKRTLCNVVKRECIERNCLECGVDDLIAAVREKIGDKKDEVKEWKRWEKTSKASKDLVIKSSHLNHIVDVLKGDLLYLAKHMTTAQWQRKQYQDLAENLPSCHGMCTADFSENYVCKFQNQVQSAHWSYRQVTVHPCVFFYRCPQIDCDKRATEYLIFLSDDLKHDSSFTRTVFDHSIRHAKSKGIMSLHIFSDGCPCHYKSKHPFHHLCKLQQKHPSVKLSRHFFGSNHGKALCDSSGGIVKNYATRAVASGNYSIQNAEEMYNFCCKKLSLAPKDHDLHGDHVLRSFVLIKPRDVRKFQDAENVKTLKGTRDIHCLVPLQHTPGIFKTRLLSCFCSNCLLGEDGECENGSFTLDWNTATVNTLSDVQTASASGVQNAPSSGVQNASSSGVQNAPSSGVQSAPSSGVQNASSSSVQNARFSGAQNAPSSGVQNASSSGVKKAPSSRVQNASSSGVKKAPSSRVQNASSSGVKKAPSSRVQNASSSGVKKAPSSRVQNASSSGVKKAPSSRVQNASSSGAQNAPSSGVQNAFSSGVKKAPSSRVQNASSSGVKKAPPSRVQNASSSGVQNASSCGVQNAPSSGVQNVLTSGAQTSLTSGVQTAPVFCDPTNPTAGVQNSDLLNNPITEFPVTSSLVDEHAAPFACPGQFSTLPRRVRVKLDKLMCIKDRKPFFKETQALLCACTSFPEIQNIAPAVLELMAPFVIAPRRVTLRDLQRYRTDDCVMALLPNSAPVGHIPISVTGDGNCMPRSICLAVSGSDTWHTELRCRIVIELAVNEQLYVSGTFLEGDCGDLERTKLLDTIAKLSTTIVTKGENDIDIPATFHAEVMAVRQHSIYMGMWQLFAAANLLKCNVISVYPSKGWPVFRHLHNRVCRPADGKAIATISIMWTSSRSDMNQQHWVANHIVPLIPDPCNW